MAGNTLLQRQHRATLERQEPPELLTWALIEQFYLPMKRRTVDRMISSGLFPKADIAIGGKLRFWKRETIESWIAGQAGQAK